MPVQFFTARELRSYNGKGGTPVYVAYQGKVYDVTRSFLWRHGWHQATHPAGVDLTNSLIDAPHGMELLERFPVVGWLVEELSGEVGD